MTKGKKDEAKIAFESNHGGFLNTKGGVVDKSETPEFLTTKSKGGNRVTLQNEEGKFLTQDGGNFATFEEVLNGELGDGGLVLKDDFSPEAVLEIDLLSGIPITLGTNGRLVTVTQNGKVGASRYLWNKRGNEQFKPYGQTNLEASDNDPETLLFTELFNSRIKPL